MVALNSAEQVWLISRPASSSIPTTSAAGTVEMSVQSPFEPAGKVPNSPRLTVVFI